MQAFPVRSALAQGAPVLDRFADVAVGDDGGAIQVGDGARHAQDAVPGARRPVELLHRAAQRRFGPSLEAAPAVDFTGIQLLVAFLLARQLALKGRFHARSDDARCFAVRVGRQPFGRYGPHFDLHIDAIQQRTGNAALITQDHVGWTAAGQRLVAEIAAWAWIHGGNQLETRWEIGLARGARDGDFARLHWFAQHFQYAPVKLGQLVEKEHAAMGQRNFTRMRNAAVKILIK